MIKTATNVPPEAEATIIIWLLAPLDDKFESVVKRQGNILS